LRHFFSNGKASVVVAGNMIADGHGNAVAVKGIWTEVLH